MNAACIPEVWGKKEHLCKFVTRLRYENMKEASGNILLKKRDAADSLTRVAVNSLLDICKAKREYICEPGVWIIKKSSTRRFAVLFIIQWLR